MSILDKKVDFTVFFTVRNANPNGDPLMDNMPRTDYEGYGEVSDVCIKRKIRNRLQDMGYDIFVQSQDRLQDGHKSLEARFDAEFSKKDRDEEVAERACMKWIDVRSFGQVVTFQKRSLGIRGPVSISLAKSLSEVEAISMQITRSTNGMMAEEGKSRSSDTMGLKSYIDFGVYKFTGSINCYFAEKTGFTEEDATQIKEALRTLFINDMSSARPEGSMEVRKIYWFIHPNKLGVASSAKINSLVNNILPNEQKITSYEEYNIEINKEKYEEYKKAGLVLEELEGI
ncbi:MAG: type I-C CRISPR-associated protein Cas7/Csd2 [Clostridiaceae bacterium]|nr:type I-C CRISPR-associated protein Cas7/Csd2 [Clostridiaceae bacterium]